MYDQIKPIYGDLEIASIKEYIESDGWGTDYEKTEEFENLVADFLEVQFCSAVPSGTAGLILSMMALGIGAGDEVIVPHVTMIATINAVFAVGAEPVLSGVPKNLCSTSDSIKAVVTDKTKAVIYVSLNGRANDLYEIADFCRSRGIFLIEDACQSFGSKYVGSNLGTIGDVGVYSLSPHKIISTGQGGLIVTNQYELNRRIERLKDFGRDSGGSDIHENYGLNFKFPDFLAAIGIAQFKRLKERIEAKKNIFDWYRIYLGGDVQMGEPQEGWVPWFIDIKVENRQKLIKLLKDAGIGTRPMYPLLSEQPFLKLDRVPKDESTDGWLFLPSSVDLTVEDIKFISNKINEFVKQ